MTGRRLRIVVFIGSFLLAAASAAFGYWMVQALSDANAYGVAVADTLPVGSTPTITGSTKTGTDASTVTVSFAKQATSASSGSAAITSYTIRRLDSSDATESNTSCTGTTAMIECSETNVPDGTWKYVVLARYGTSWVGEPGTASDAVELDTTAPSVTTVIGQAAGATVDGFVKKGTAYFVYANVTDARSSVASVTADVANVTTGATSVALSSGSFTSPSGASFNYRSAVLTSNSTLADGALAYTVNATDSSSNTSTNTNNGSVTIDTTGPSVGAPSLGSTYYTTLSIPVTLGSVADGGAGVDTGTIVLQRAVGTLSSTGIPDGGCTLYGTFSTIATNPSSPYTDTAVSSGSCYRYQVVASDKISNASTSASSTDAKVDTSAPSTPAVTLSGATGGKTFISGTTAYINPQVGNSGTFSVSATTTDAQSGIASVGFPTPSGFTGGGVDSSSTYDASYSWNGAVSGSGSQTVTATNNAGLQATSSFTVTPDTTGPVVPIPSIAGGYYTTASVPVTLGTITDAGSGVNTGTAVLQRDQVALSNDTCGSFPGTFGTTVTLAGGNDTTVVSGFCYRYRRQASDNVGNQTTSSSSNVAKIDTSAPTGTTATLSAASGNTFISGSTVYINAQSGRSGSFTASATSADTESGIAKVTFPTLAGFSTGGGDDTSSPYSTAYSWSGAAGASGSQAVTATNNANLTASTSFTVTPDTTAPSGGSVTVPAYSTATSVSVTFAAGTDSGSGVATSTGVLARASATYDAAGGTCGSFGSFTQVGSTGLSSPFSNTGLTPNTCYQYRYTVSDNVGNSVSYTGSTVIVDTTAPTVTINQAAGQADPTSGATINFTVVFSEPTTTFATGDVTITGTAGGTKTATVTGSGTTYNVAVTGMTTAGTVIADVAAGVATDAAGNANVASTSTDKTVTWNAAGLVLQVNSIDEQNSQKGRATFKGTGSSGTTQITVTVYTDSACTATAGTSVSITPAGAGSWGPTGQTGNLNDNTTYYARATQGANSSACISVALPDF